MYEYFWHVHPGDTNDCGQRNMKIVIVFLNRIGTYFLRKLRLFLQHSSTLINSLRENGDGLDTF